MNHVRKALDMENVDVTLFTDSQIVLNWIAAVPSKWNTFVANRVSEIQTEGSNFEWLHVSSENNPSDIISRGISVEKLAHSTFWFDGPDWLSLKREHWECNRVCNVSSTCEENVVSFVATTEDFCLFNRYSSFYKLLRVTAYIKRFAHNCNRKNKRLTGILSAEEIENAHYCLIRRAQQESFPQEFHSLIKNKNISNDSRIKALSPFVHNGLLRVGGRLSESDLPFSQKHPILLCNHHILTELIVKHYHYKYLHFGGQSLLAQIRLRYWPIRAKVLIKKIVRRCLVCFRYSPGKYVQKMGNLPRDRVSVPTRCFQVVQLDYAGPIQMKSGFLRGHKAIKGYIAVFICFASKAIHLELVTSLTTESFLNCFKRFISRRGLPQKIYSDNATNFVGSSNYLKQLHCLANEDSFQTYLANHFIKWSFSPPRSPHMAGLVESHVKIVKRHLYKTLNSQLLDYESLYTILCKIESCVNSRPLYSLSDDPQDMNALTPGHFLIGQSLIALPEKEESHSPNGLKLYRKLISMFQLFWQRWKKDYLQCLQNRYKWRDINKDPVKQGDLAILKDVSPPMFWPMGRIIDVFPGKDALTRVVTIKTPSGTYKRAVQNIVPLPKE
jgi:hypothetical protein